MCKRLCSFGGDGMKNKYLKLPEKVLMEKIDELKIQLINASNKVAGQKVPQTMRSNIRKEIARIKTELRKREINNG